MTNKELFLLGVKHSIPICFGYLSVGTAYAVMALQAGYTSFETIIMSVLCYSGSGQFFNVTMSREHAGLFAIGLGILLLNFRYFIMSACVFVRLKTLSTPLRFIFAHFITDEPFAIFSTARQEYLRLSYFFGLVIFSWFSWIMGAVIGVVASDYLPDSLIAAMNVALYALFIAIVVPACMKNSMLLVIVTVAAVLNIVLSRFFDACTAILISIVVCSLIGAHFLEGHDIGGSKEDKLEEEALKMQRKHHDAENEER